MRIQLRFAAVAALLVTTCVPVCAAPQAVAFFARRPQMRNVTISADGRYVAFLSGTGDETVLMTFDRTQPDSTFKRVTASEPGKFDIGQCRWANDTRLLCTVYGNVRGKKFAEPPFKRVFAVDADGAALTVLEKSRSDGNLLVARTSMRNFNINYGADIEKNSDSPYFVEGNGEHAGPSVALNYIGSHNFERQDEILDLLPGDKEHILIENDEDHDSYPSVFKLGIYDGKRVQFMPQHPPIQNFVTDGAGNPRIGWGASRDSGLQYFARLAGEQEWRPLKGTNVLNGGTLLRPIAMTPATNLAYAVGNHSGRDALWAIDLAGKQDPQLLFHHPLVDVGEPILQSDRRLLGVRYDVERPYVWYADPKFRELIDRLEKVYPGRVHDIIDSSEDKKTLIVQSSSDVDEGTYFVYDVDKDKLNRLGTAYPELGTMTLGKMTNIIYKASDGTEIPGYLTLPSGAERKNLPLVVMPHDGPQDRDSWKFSFLRNFLANRGYAVLQTNYRGSDGFGRDWRLEGRNDWNDVAYSDIQDATRWAVSEGIADPKRICIMGWGFGGYEALLSAAREGDRYRCAVSIAGIADLEMQRQLTDRLGKKEAVQKLDDAQREKFRRESPLYNAEQIDIPVLLLHGTKDWQVQMDHSQAMSDALEKAKKHPVLRLIDDGGHDLDRMSERVILLDEIEKFLGLTLGPGATS